MRTDDPQQLRPPPLGVIPRLVLSGCGLAIILLLLLGAVLYLAATAPPGGGPWPIGLPSETVVFESKSGGFTMRIPSTWVGSDLPGGTADDKHAVATVSVPGRTLPFVSVSRMEFPTGSLADVAAWGEEAILEVRSGTHLENTAESPDDSRASRGYTYAEETLLGNVEIRCIDWYLLEGTVGYRMAFCSKEDEWPLVEDVFGEMAGSFVP
jgi:hypothetical protein